MGRENKQELFWNLYSLGVIIIATIFQLLRWRMFPMFMDIYYHLSVMLGFDRAGGYVARAFWEYAPIGRPHLYPPFLHIIMLGFYKLGFSKLFIARFFNFLMYPLLLTVVWIFSRKLFNKIFAFFAVLLAASSYFFYLEVSNITSFSLSLMLGLQAVLSLEKNKKNSGVLLLVLAFYSHILAGWLLLAALFIYGIFNKKLTNTLRLVFPVLVLISPFLIHQISNREFFRFVDAPVLHEIYINIPIYIFASIGIIACLEKKQRYYLLLAFLIGFLPLLLNYKQRFLSGQGMIALIFLGAAGGELAAEWLSRIKLKTVSYAVGFLIFTGIYLFPLTIFFVPRSPVLLTWKSAFINLFLPEQAAGSKTREKSLGENMYNPRFIEPIVKIIKENSKADEIIYSDINYAAGMLSVFSGRPTSTAMLLEVMPFRKFDPIASSRIIVRFKELDDTFPRQLEADINKYGLEKIAETDLAYIYRTPGVSKSLVIPRPLIATPVLFLILLVASAPIIYGNLSRKSPGNK